MNKIPRYQNIPITKLSRKDLIKYCYSLINRIKKEKKWNKETVEMFKVITYINEMDE